MFLAYAQLVDLVLLAGYAIDITEAPPFESMQHLRTCFEAGLNPYEAAFMFANGIPPALVVVLQ